MTQKQSVFKMTILTILIFEGLMLHAAQADTVCDCVNTSTYPAPNNKIHYQIKCYLKGVSQETLEAGDLSTAQEVEERTKHFREHYKAPSCVWLPGGKMIAPLAE